MPENSLALPYNILNGLNYLNKSDAQAFLKKCRRQSKDRRQLAHTMMELIVGVFGATTGLAPRYEPKVEGQTPDWLFLDAKGKPQFLGEVVNFHINESIEKKMEKDLQNQGSWFGELPGSEERLYPSLKGKVVKYKELADNIDLPLVIFVYPSFDAFVHPKEIEFCLRDEGCKLFNDYPEVTGVYHFDDGLPCGREWMQPGYRFRFYANLAASRPLTLSDGLCPSQFQIRRSSYEGGGQLNQSCFAALPPHSAETPPTIRRTGTSGVTP